MELTLYQIDAFANRRFEGNPAAVCPLEHWLDEDPVTGLRFYPIGPLLGGGAG